MSLTLFPIAQALAPFTEAHSARLSLAHYRAYYQLDDLLTADVQHIAGQVMSSGTALALQAWIVPKQVRPTALCVHGYFDHSGWSRPLIEVLLAQGYNVCCLDLPGHGLSNGERASIHHFDDYGAAIFNATTAIKSWLAPVSLAVGHSTGAAAWLNCLSLFKRIDCPLILFAPLLRPAEWQYWGRGLYALLKPFTSHFPRKKRASSSNPVFNRAFEADPLVPNYLTLAWVGAMRHWLQMFEQLAPLANRTLIIQGQRDSTVDWRYNIPHLLKKLPNTELHYLAEAKHQLINEAPAIQLQWQILTAAFLTPSSV